MATKSEKKTEVTEEAAFTAAEEAAVVDPMKVLVTRVVPYAPRGEQQSLWACLNGKAYNIPRGKPVELPQPVWEIIDSMLAAERKHEEELRRTN